METQIRQIIKDFNLHSSNTEDHFKLCVTLTYGTETLELRLCSCHPRLMKCTTDGVKIHVTYHGPDRFHVIFSYDHASLCALLTFLHSYRDDKPGLLEWELDDWVSAGYSCNMHEKLTHPEFPALCFTRKDLWCIEEFPSRSAGI